MKSLSLLAVAAALALAAPTGAAAQTAEPKPIEIMPGATVEAEISLTNQDLLPLFKRLLTALGGVKPPAGAPPQVQSMLSDLNPKELADALQGLEAIQFVTYTMPAKPDVYRDVEQFYSKVVEAHKLRRVASVKPDAKTAILVYGGPELSLFGLVVTTEGAKNRVLAGELRGQVDMEKLMNFVSRVGMMVMPIMGHRLSTDAPAPSKGSEAAPKPAPKTAPKPAPTPQGS